MITQSTNERRLIVKYGKFSSLLHIGMVFFYASFLTFAFDGGFFLFIIFIIITSPIIYSRLMRIISDKSALEIAEDGLFVRNYSKNKIKWDNVKISQTATPYGRDCIFVKFRNPAMFQPGEGIKPLHSFIARWNHLYYLPDFIRTKFLFNDIPIMSHLILDTPLATIMESIDEHRVH